MSAPRIYRSKLPDAELTDQDLLTYVFENHGNIKPEIPAFIDAVSGETRSHGAVLSRTRRLIHVLDNLGVHEREIVAYWSPNTIGYAETCLGIIGRGATVATFAPALTPKEFRNQMEIVDAKFLIVHSSLIDTAQLAIQDLPLSWILQSDGHRMDGMRTIESLVDLSIEADIVKVPQKDTESRITVISFTSGIVGPAKAVKISHKNLTSNLIQWDAVQGNCRETAGTWIAFVGFSGVHGLMAFVLATMRTGMTTVVMSGFDWHIYLGCVQKYRPMQLHVGPPVIYAMIEDQSIASLDLSSVRRILSGGAPLPLEAARAVQDTFNRHWGTAVCCHQLLGMSETSPAAAFGPPDEHAVRPGIGYIIPNMEFRFVDPFTLRDAIMGQDGVTEPAEIWCRGPNVTKGYVQSEATQNAFHVDENGNEWLRSGDMGTIDSSGWIELKDRIIDVIRLGGATILPSKLESKIQEHPHVTHSCVVTRRDEIGEQFLTGFVVLQPGLRNLERGIVEQAILDWANERVTPHETLRGGIRVVDSIAQTMGGKLLRRQMRDLLQCGS
ncbi:hypothetical protein F4821DRAFT_251375 [Hypoxylon rubiginosum]|uniref:Uncharacterized protein n=1 Tax=Hypoxylon rubiginosum TaxID=110542 RepID=A0ACC0CJD4_9PEZI|nr:hypothetical protein F4821DRAFT_251375 [Hypoxylon rubiginosum]